MSTAFCGSCAKSHYHHDRTSRTLTGSFLLALAWQARLLVGYVFGLPSAMTCLASAALVEAGELAATALAGIVVTLVVPFGVLLPVWLYVYRAIVFV